MNLLSLPHPQMVEALDAILTEARSRGFKGFGGECGEAAVAINRVLFAGAGSIVAGLNVALQEHGRFVGHFAVCIDDKAHGLMHIDCDGSLKNEDEIESWGMLDPDDLDWHEFAQAHGFEFTEDVAEGAAMFAFDNEAEVLRLMPGTGLDAKVAIPEDALRAHIQPPERTKNAVALSM